MIYITGDTHGEQSRFIDFEKEKWNKDDTIIICGDFGYIFTNSEAENIFLDSLQQCPYTICFIDGNHENFHVINSYPIEEWNGGKVHRIRSNIIYLMRGQVFEIEGKTFFTMGGAYSYDRNRRRLNYSYWEEEIPCGSEYKEATNNLDRYNNKVDYILSHTAPKEIVYKIGYTPDMHDMELTGFLEYIMYKVEHKHWYCGHWHRDDDFSGKFTLLWFDIRTIP